DGPAGDLFVADISEAVTTRLNPEATLLVIESWTPQRGASRGRTRVTRAPTRGIRVRLFRPQSWQRPRRRARTRCGHPDRTTCSPIGHPTRVYETFPLLASARGA